MNRLIARIVGEAAATGTAARADQLPPRPDPAPQPEVNTPDDDTVYSLADQRHRESGASTVERDQVDVVLEMWRSGNKYDACAYMLFSNYLYTDFVRLIQGMPVNEGLEMGGILDETAPTYSGPEYEPSNAVASAISSEGSRELRGEQEREQEEDKL